MAVIETGQDDTVDQGAVEEQAKIDQARADLYDEAAGNEPGEPEESLILGKYKSQSDLVALTTYALVNPAKVIVILTIPIRSIIFLALILIFFDVISYKFNLLNTCQKYILSELM